MNAEGGKAIGKCYGSVTVGARGQVVIPTKVRKELDIEAKTKLLVFECFQGKGLLFIKWETMARLVSLAHEDNFDSE